MNLRNEGSGAAPLEFQRVFLFCYLFIFIIKKCNDINNFNLCASERLINMYQFSESDISL